MSALRFNEWINEPSQYYPPGSSGWYRQMRKRDEINAIWEQVKDDLSKKPNYFAPDNILSD
jgi:hypothetical protein